MKKRLIQALARLASVAYQDAYIVHGTADEYVLPEDIVEDVASLCQLTTKSQYTDSFNAVQREKLANLQRGLKGLGNEFWVKAHDLAAGQLVHESEVWARLRSMSADCLQSFGIDVREMAATEIDSM